MRALVTGITGQVGGAIVQTLSPKLSVVAANRQKIDLAQPDRITAALEEISPDLIINPAAYTAVDRAEDERELAYKINAEAPGVIARWAAARRVPLIHFSTDYVFDGSGSRAWREDDLTRPLSVYGKSKLAGEQAVVAAGGSYLIVRTSWVYAATGSNFLRTITRLALERKALRIVADQIGAPTSAQLIAEVLANIITVNPVMIREIFARAKGIVNVAASGEITWHGFAVAILSGLRARGVKLMAEEVTPIVTKDHPTKAKRPMNSRLDLGRLRDVFKIEPPPWDKVLNAELDQVAALPYVKS